MTTSRLHVKPLALLAVLLLLPTVTLPAEDAADLDTVLQQLEANRRLVVEENMNLSKTQKDPFWEIYGEYRQEMSELQAAKFRLLREFRGSFDELTDERAKDMLTRYLDIEAGNVKIRQKYIKRFNQILAAKQTLRFYQIDVKVDSIIQTEMSATNPLAAG